MTVFIDISDAFDGHLDDMAGKPDVAWSNKAFDPVIGTTFVRPALLPAGSVQASLGDSGLDENIGIYQIDIFAEAGKGKNEGMVTADLIADHFKRGTVLTSNGRNVRIKSVSQLSARVNPDGWFQIPIEVSYISYTAARI